MNGIETVFFFAISIRQLIIAIGKKKNLKNLQTSEFEESQQADKINSNKK